MAGPSSASFALSCPSCHMWSQNPSIFTDDRTSCVKCSVVIALDARVTELETRICSLEVRKPSYMGFDIVYGCLSEIQCNKTEVTCCHGNLCNALPTNTPLTPPTNTTLTPPTNTTLTQATPTNTTLTQATPTNTTLTQATPTNTTQAPLQCHVCFSFASSCPVSTCAAGTICGTFDSGVYFLYKCFTEKECNITEVTCCHGNLCNAPPTKTTKATPTNTTLTQAPPTNTTLTQAPPTNTTLTQAPPTNTTLTQAPPTNTTLTQAPPTTLTADPLQCYSCNSDFECTANNTCQPGYVCGQAH
ncbi:hypothetical protein WMY93_033357, partial [Mugilogobius chulae]